MGGNEVLGRRRGVGGRELGSFGGGGKGGGPRWAEAREKGERALGPSLSLAKIPLRHSRARHGVCGRTGSPPACPGAFSARDRP